MESMFYNNMEFDGDLSTWSMSQVVTTVSMFQNAASFSGTGVDLWDVSSVQNMTSMVSLWPRLVEFCCRSRIAYVANINVARHTEYGIVSRSSNV
jgi:Mycoplasma protein of unknown function, DUF285